MLPGLPNTLSAIADFLECRQRFAGVEGSLADLEGYTLLHLAAGGPGLGAVVAVGSSPGRAAAFLAAGARGAGREQVAAVGLCQGRIQEDLRRLSLADHVLPIVACSAEAARQWQGPIRLLVLAGDHSDEAARQDFELWSPFVVAHGLICFHDVSGRPGVTCFYQELLRGTGASREVATVLSMKIVQKLARPAVTPACPDPGAGVRENNRGVQLLAQRRHVEAEAAFRHALALEPNLPPEVQYNLAKALQNQEKFGEAEPLYRHVLEHRPDWAECHYSLATLCFSRRRLADAEAAYRRALQHKPDHVEAMNSLAANVLTHTGRTDEAAAVYRQALAVQPEHAVCHSNLLLNEHYRPGVTPAGLAEAHAAWEGRHAAPLRSAWRPFAHDRDPERPLRVGFVSADFGLHPVGLFLAPVLERLRPPEWSTVCYANQRKADEQTQRLARAAGLWRNVADLDDEALAAQVRADGIDLLLDLSGHTGGNRLLTFARRPAPVQLTWMAYVGTTGLAAMDYLIADRFHVPAGAERHYVEKVLRLPAGYLCYEPPAYAPAVGPLPALAAGRVTFGAFHNPAKITPRVVATWADVLRRVAGSRLVLKSHWLDDADLRRRLTEQFAAHGIAAGRLELLGNTGHREQLERYNTVDLALDSFPYSGGLTTCEACWMGVPVVTCPGETFASRHSLGHLSNAGLTETIAADPADSVGTAVRLAHDLPRLADLRAGLRPRMAGSSLCDAARFTVQFAAALRGAWRDWVAAPS
jgi:protein O-GlcNAc transferase